VVATVVVVTDVVVVESVVVVADVVVVGVVSAGFEVPAGHFPLASGATSPFFSRCLAAGAAIVILCHL
jgi:hypothetical protein